MKPSQKNHRADINTLWCQKTSGCWAKGWAAGILRDPLQLGLFYSSVIKPKNPHGTKLLSQYKRTRHQ